MTYDYDDDCIDKMYDADDKFRLSEYPLSVKYEPDTDVEKKVVCDCCHGDGTVYHIVAHWNTAYGNYLPDEVYSECDECRGKGFVWTDDWEDKELWELIFHKGK